jgi:hypothetical protein
MTTTRTFTPHSAASAPAQNRKADSPRSLSSSAIAAHLAAFKAAGGKMEVLATTTVLRRIQAEPGAVAPSVEATKPTPPKRGKPSKA